MECIDFQLLSFRSANFPVKTVFDGTVALLVHYEILCFGQVLFICWSSSMFFSGVPHPLSGTQAITEILMADIIALHFILRCFLTVE